MCSNLPALLPMKPRGTEIGALEIFPVLYEEDKNEVMRHPSKLGVTDHSGIPMTVTSNAVQVTVFSNSK